MLDSILCLFCTILRTLMVFIAFIKHKQRVRFQYYTCPVSQLEEHCLQRLYILYRERHDITQDDFQQLLIHYTDSVLLRSSVDGSLRGFFLFGKEVRHQHGWTCTLIKVGHASFKENSTELESSLQAYFFIYQYIKETLLHPTRPIYFLSKFSSCTNYLWLADQASLIYPSCKKPTPVFERTMITEYVEATRSPRDVYNPENSTEESRTVNSVPDELHIVKDNRHLQFFVEKNPGWQLGNSLCTIWSFDSRLIWHELLGNTQTGNNKNELARKYVVQQLVQDVLISMHYIIHIMNTSFTATE